MVKLILTLILLYCIYVVYFFIGDHRRKKRRKDIVGSGSNLTELSRRTEDIVGKSKFNLSHSLPEATTTLKTEKGTENPDIFVPSNDTQASAEVPPEELDEAFSDTPSDEDNEPMDIDVPLEYEDNEPEEEPEPEEEEVEGTAQAALASGVSFEELGNAVRAVNHSEEATQKQKEEAGRTLLEMRQTDMFEQLVSGKPDRAAIVSEFMDAHLSAFYRKLEAESSDKGSNGGKKVPADFDIRNFA